MRLGRPTPTSAAAGSKRVLAEALQKHGAIIVDNGSAFYLSGAPHASWDNDDLHSLRTLTGDDFEFVRSQRMKTDPDSMRVKPRFRD